VSRRVRYSEEEARAAVAASRSYSDALMRLGLRPAGGNHATLKKYLALWGISTDHFDPWRNVRPWREAKPLADILVEESTYPRRHLKRRLLAEGVKEARCEMCGQGELVAELEASTFLAVGRKYGVSDNAIRKWLRAYEAMIGQGSCELADRELGP
jgi:hypothetical protein